MDVSDALNALIKSGEGSKGGKVIGHTKSGKPIYDSFSHPEHKGFSPADHKDAMMAHANSESPNEKAMNQHRQKAAKEFPQFRDTPRRRR